MPVVPSFQPFPRAWKAISISDFTGIPTDSNILCSKVNDLSYLPLLAVPTLYSGSVLKMPVPTLLISTLSTLSAAQKDGIS